MILRPTTVEDTDNWMFIGLALIPAIIIALVVFGHAHLHPHADPDRYPHGDACPEPDEGAHADTYHRADPHDPVL
jgi:hypothetical protein